MEKGLMIMPFLISELISNYNIPLSFIGGCCYVLQTELERIVTMSRLIYDIKLEEEYKGPNGEYKIVSKNIPHFNEIKNWLSKEWDKCKIHETFDGILKDKVQSTTIKCIQKSDGTPVARIYIDFIPNFRLSQKCRLACWEQLDSQMADGFGESYDHIQIPNVELGWSLYL